MQDAVRDPLPWVHAALIQVGRSAGETPTSIQPGMPIATLEETLLGILGPDPRTEVPLIPHPTALPLSRAFAAHPAIAGVIVPRYGPGFSAGFRYGLRKRHRFLCSHCARREQELYAHTPWDRRRRTPGPRTVMIQGPLAIAHLDSQPEKLTGARPLCSRCHNVADRCHTRSAKALAQAFRGQLTQDRLEFDLSTLRRAAAEGERPLGALQPGGSDLMVAVMADREMSLTASSAAGIIPALGNEITADINRVIAAAVWRLQLRGLMGSDHQLTRLLTCPQPERPEQPQFLPRP